MKKKITISVIAIFTILFTIEIRAQVSANAFPDNYCNPDSSFITVSTSWSGSKSYSWESDPPGFSSTSAYFWVYPTVTTTYSVTVTNNQSATGTDDVTVTVNPSPAADAGSDQKICQNTCTDITASGGGTYLWNTGSTDTTINVCPTIETTYTVTVCNTHGCTDSDEVIVLPQPTVNAGNDTAICKYENLQLDGTASHQKSVLWTTSGTGNFTNPTIPDPIYITSQNDMVAGFVILTLTAYGKGLCASDSASDNMTLTINPLPIANFSFSPDNVCAPATIQFTDNSTGNGLTYEWDLGDPLSAPNNTSNDTNPDHLYDTIGDGIAVYNITLIVTNNYQCKDTNNQAITILKRPDAILYNALGFRICTTTSNDLFVEDKSLPLSNSHYKIIWDDSSPNFDSIDFRPGGITHTYPGVDIYDLIYIVTNNTACIDTTKYTVYNITNPAVSASSPGNTIDCALYCLDIPISGYDTNHVSTRYAIDFGDGALDTLEHITLNDPPPDAIIHCYDSTSCFSPGIPPLFPSGAFIFSIKAMNGCDTTGAAFGNIRVYKEPIADFFIDKTPECINTDIHFIDNTINGLNQNCDSNILYYWDFGDNNYSNLQYPVHQYTQPGKYIITLKVKNVNPDNYCDTSTYIDSVCINPLPIAKFTLDTLEGCVPFSVNATNESIFSSPCDTAQALYIWSVEWTPLGCSPSCQVGFDSHTTNNSFNFTASGQYIIKLILESESCGSHDTISDTIIAKAKPYINIDPISDTCSNSIYPTATINDCLSPIDSCVWFFPNGIPSTITCTITNQNPGQINYPSPSHDTVIVKAYNECGMGTDSIYFKIYPSLTADAGVDTSICEGDSIELAGKASGGSNDFSYLWHPSGTITNDSSISVSPSLTTTYTLTVTDIITGCTDSDTVIVSIMPIPTSYAGIDDTICQNDCIDLTASGGGTFLWNTGKTEAIINVCPTVKTTYTVTVTNANTCTDSDKVIVYIQPLPSANTGLDDTICEDGSYTLSGADTSNCSTILWSTAGDGSFNYATLLTAIYTPGPLDIANGSVVLTLTGIGIIPCNTITDTMTLTIQPLPLAAAGTDATICEDASCTMNGVATNQSSVLWTTLGDGNFDDATLLAAIYTPGPNDISSGSVVLTLTAIGIVPCNTITDTITLFIQLLPLANAGTDATICEDDKYTLQGTASNQSSALWTSVGDGSFNDATLLAAIYTPGPNDISSGSVVLTLTSIATGPCKAAANDDMTLIIQLLPLVDAGVDATICEDALYTLQGTAVNQSSVLWTSVGDGDFNDATLIAATYTPGPLDIAAGSVILSLTSIATVPCNTSAASTMTLFIQLLPLADAGTDATICEDATYILQGTVANQSSTLWTSLGDGGFNNATLLGAVYTPGPLDIANGSVSLVLLANAILPCVTVTVDTIAIKIQPFPSVDAGLDATICEDANYTFMGTAANQSSVLWTTVGDGGFNNATLLGAVYTPGPMDIVTGSVDFTLTANATGPCTGKVTSAMTLYIQLLPFAEAGLDATICEDEKYTLQGTAANQSSVLWTTVGDGAFNDATLLAAIYTPGPLDIANGSVVLFLTANVTSPCTNGSMDNMTLIIQKTPLAGAGMDATICEDATYTLQGTAANQSSVLWISAGNGTFSDPTLLGAIYTLGSNDIIAGSVVLTLTVTAISPCTGTVKSIMTLTIIPLPDTDAGLDDAICEYETFPLSGIANNYSSLQWTGGDGNFSDITIVDPVYMPGPNDILAGSVTLYLTAFGLSPCGNSTNSLILTINPEPTPAISGPIEVCEFEAGVIYSTPDVPGNTYNWVVTVGSITLGQGTNQITVTWGPSGFGTVIVTETVGSTGCFFTTQNYDVLINPLPIVDAGPDQTIPYDTWTTLNGTISGSGTYTYSWSPATLLNDATIEDPTTVNLIATTQYVLIATDVLTGCVNTDTVRVFVEGNPLSINVQAIKDTLCEGDVTNLFSNVVGGSGTYTYLWTSNPGVFTSAQQNPTDAPFVNTWYNLTVYDGFNTVKDSVLVIVIPYPTIDAGSDTTVCEGATFTLSGLATNYATITWSTAGDGAFDDALLLGATYTPGTADIAIGTVVLTLTVTGNYPCTTLTDTITLFIQLLPQANAGTDATICEDATCTLQGTAANQSSVLWSTSGNGVFNDATLLAAIYSPGPLDIANGSVVLTLTSIATNPCSTNVTDTMTLFIQLLPIANAGIDATICEDSTYTLTGSADNKISTLWTTTGDGTFNDATFLIATYTPGPLDIAAGSLIVTLHVIGDDPCDTITDDMTLTIQMLPLADAGLDATICEDAISYTLSGLATNQSSVLWTSVGDGGFNDATLLGAIYTPGPLDIANGSVVLTLPSIATGPCTATATDDMTLFIQMLPLVDAGIDATICEDADYTLQGTASNYTSVLWATTGDGGFNDATLLGAIYTPGAYDRSVGLVDLILTAYATGPCTIADTDTMTMIIQSIPVANAGADATICEDSTSYTLSGIGSNQSWFFWTTSGDGVFNDATLLTAIYTPGPIDITVDSVVLTLKANYINPCTIATTDNMTLFIQPLPHTDAGIDATICEDATYTLNGIAANQSSILWITAGDGDFNDATLLTAIYTPGPLDIANGSAVLTLTASATGSCTTAVSDDMTLFIQLLPLADAGNDATICEDATFTLQGTAANQSSVLWTSAGNGTFNDVALLGAKYTPGSNDISNGTVTLILTANTILPCAAVAFDSIIITIQHLPFADAGTDATICEDETFTLQGTAANQNSVLWTSAGNGSFNDTTLLTAIYTPGTLDIANGSVVLTLKSIATGSCTTAASDNMTLVIQLLPLAYAGTDATICEDANYTLLGTAANQSSVLWTTSGNGSFNDATLPGAIYTPDLADIAAGLVVLTLTSSATSPCNTSATSTMTLFIQLLPLADAGVNSTICEDTTYTLNGTAANQNSVVWTTAGDGSFNNATILAATYTPGSLDITSGSVILTLTANAFSPCITSVTATMTLTIIPLPEADAGIDNAICEYETYTLNGIANNYSSLQWTGGTGTFSDATILIPVYTPSPDDIYAGAVCISLTTFGLSPCGVYTDSIILTINPSPTPVISGPNDTCEFTQGVNYSTPDMPGNTFNWDVIGGIINTGQGTNQITIDWGSAGTGTVTLIETTPEGCNDTITAYLINLNPLPIAYAGADTNICVGDNVTITASGGVNYLWDTGQTIKSITVSPTVTTTYAVTVSDNMGCTESDDITVTVLEIPIIWVSQGDVEICRDSSIDLTANGAVSYTWYPATGLSSSSGSIVSAFPTNTTTYTITGTSSYGCTGSGTVTVKVYLTPTTPVLSLIDSIYLCLSESLILDAGRIDDWNSYLWNDGSTNQRLFIEEPGIYWIKIANLGCYVTDSIIINPCTEIWVPNAFTPGGAYPINNIFKAKGENIRKFQMWIYNRWGQQVFVSNNIQIGWDGKFNGILCQTAVYVWVIRYTDHDGKEKERMGHITLLR